MPLRARWLAVIRLGNISVEHRAGLVNLAIAGAVGFLAWFSWWIMQDEPARPAVQRAFHQVTVTWHCDQGHEYESFGALGPQPCPTCGADAYVMVSYRCSEHGLMQARLQHERDENGNLVVSAVGFRDDEWITSPLRINCPYCGRELSQVRPDIYSNLQNKGR